MNGGRRQTEEEVGRQHQGMDRPGVLQIKNRLKGKPTVLRSVLIRFACLLWVSTMMLRIVLTRVMRSSPYGEIGRSDGDHDEQLQC